MFDGVGALDSAGTSSAWHVQWGVFYRTDYGLFA
jgi:hypothetical protein